MRILVTGGAGFIGGAITKRLIKDGHEVSITTTGAEDIPAGVHKAYYPSFEGLDMKCVRNKDVIFHQAANNDTLCNDENEMHRSNVTGPMKLFLAAIEAGVKKFIYASSTAVYGDAPAPYCEETTPLNPLNEYAKSKAAFEREVDDCWSTESNDFTVIGLRYCNVYGPGEGKKGRRMSMIGQLLRKSFGKDKIQLFEDGSQLRDWIYIDDVVHANILSMNREFEGGHHIFNIGSGKSISFNDIYKLIGTATERFRMRAPTSITYVPCPFADKYQNHTECNIDKAKRELGFSPEFSFASGIKAYCDDLLATSDVVTNGLF